MKFHGAELSEDLSSCYYTDRFTIFQHCPGYHRAISGNFREKSGNFREISRIFPRESEHTRIS